MGPRIGQPRYVRRVAGDRWQARPYDAASGTRHNLGTFPTRWEACRAVALWLSGALAPLPRFVRRVRTRKGVRYYGLVPPRPRARARGRERVPGLYETAPAAAAAVAGYLTARDGPAAAARLLERPDESGRTPTGTPHAHRDGPAARPVRPAGRRAA